MDPAELSAQAVRVITQLVEGAAPASLTGAGQGVLDLVRQRLGGTPSGAAAFAAVGARPDDPAAVAGLHDALGAVVAADRDFAAALAAALAPIIAGPPPGDPPPRTVQNGVVIDGGSRICGSTIALGPVTFHNTPAGRGALGAVCLGLATFVALLVYGTIQALDSESPGPDADAPGDGSGDRALPLADAEAVRAVLPPVSSLPPGWTERSAPTADVSAQDDGSTFAAESRYLGRHSMETRLLVFSYPDEDGARKAFDARAGKARAEGASSLAMARIGDQTAAFALPASRGDAYDTHTSRSTVVRTGTVLTVVVGNDTESRAYSGEDLETLTRLLSERARTAQSG
ncbi:hypothetical protein [Streptomyces sp. NRRL S-920]|uniref:hypothetical protein n=1 Tax=Streptomyces sp. NRRL S-920 TaxID=1463921 RepID=UPI0004C8B7E7|nr:hypothetical protein [Streptomyces sp. NRRL S-920]